MPADPPIFDGHNDTLLDVHAGRPFLERSAAGHLDLPRAREGGFAGGLVAVFTRAPAPPGLPAAAELTRPAGTPPGPSVPRALALRRTLVVLGDPGGPLAAVAHVEGTEVLDPVLRATWGA